MLAFWFGNVARAIRKALKMIGVPVTFVLWLGLTAAFTTASYYYNHAGAELATVWNKFLSELVGYGLLAWALLFAWQLARAPYEQFESEHKSAIADRRRADALAIELSIRRNVLARGDPAFDNMLGVISAFDLLRGRPPDLRPEVWITAPPDSRDIALTVLTLASPGCKCQVHMFDPYNDPRYDALTYHGMKSGVVRLHAIEHFGHANELFEKLSVLFPVERTFELPKMWTANPEKLLWLQFGEGVKWNSARR